MNERCEEETLKLTPDTTHNSSRSRTMKTQTSTSIGILATILLYVSGSPPGTCFSEPLKFTADLPNAPVTDRSLPTLPSGAFALDQKQVELRSNEFSRPKAGCKARLNLGMAMPRHIHQRVYQLTAFKLLEASPWYVGCAHFLSK